ncbi:DUF4082 domain-containing protein [Geodermatophilus sp. SYSU D01045]
MANGTPAGLLRRGLVCLVVLAASVLAVNLSATPARAADPCATPVVSRVACENTLQGTTDWQVSPDTSIEGFTTDISTNVGGRVDFKVRTTARSYSIDVYRLGWYGGDGGRYVTTLTPNTLPPPAQPECARNAATGMVDCGNWTVSASWQVPTGAVSGVYVANLRAVTGAENQITFVVRDDASRSDVVLQTSDTTWAAYNNWGGASLYDGNGPGRAGRAYAVSYNRPLNPNVTTGRLMYAEYPMIRFLEQNGYDVSYVAGVDADRRGALLANHRLFLSVGHDEYWSGAQRSHVEAARNAGTNLAFFSGNEMWWKVRWEPSITGSRDAHRTMVSYKESLDGARTDPTGEWTGTWRDPRFATGVTPENALIGQQFKVNGEYGRRTDAISVPAEFGRARLWRNTDVARQPAGGTYTFGPGTLGYEWDADFDNGHRPAGLAKLSSTTVDVVEPDVLQDDYGVSYAPGRASHALTLYRWAPSGALVFGAGTVQWSWGLDDTHDGGHAVANTPMRQATVNLFADMGVQPVTPAGDLVPASRTTDTAPPVVTVTSPATGAVVGTPLTIAGTATDAAGVVSGVEVSVDGGTTWHPAEGRANWSYTYTPPASGPLSVRVRAVDDSARLSTPVGYDSTVGQRTCPCSLWSTATTPSVPAADDPTPVEVGVRFQPTVDGYVTGIRFYKGPGNTGTHTGTLWSAAGQPLATGSFGSESATGWQTLVLPTPEPVFAGQSYVASYYAPAGRYAVTGDYFTTRGVSNEPLVAPASTAAAPNGVYRTGSPGFPQDSWAGSNYWVDVVFQTQPPADGSAPTATVGSPAAGSSSVARTVTPEAVFSEPVQPASIVMTVTGADGAAVPGSVSYDPGTRRARFTPTGQLAAGTAHTVSVTAARDVSGNPLASPLTWTFTTMRAPATPGVCPCSVWDDTAVPAVLSAADTAGVEVGTRIRVAVDGTITGIRFYKGPQNTGTHVGTLWSATGQELARATFGPETTSGWQQVSFSQPVTVTAGTTLVVSYHTDTGGYSMTAGGLATAVTSGPLTALADGDGGGNGVYSYGARTFPTQRGSANYWVDAVFVPAQDTTPPAVEGTTPGAAATSVSVDVRPSITFTEPVQAGSATMTVTRDGGGAVAGTVAATDTSRGVVFTPTAALAAGATYTVSVTGAKDRAGNTMSAHTWRFTTAGNGSCPCTVFGDAVPATPAVSDTSAVELGVRIRSDVDGWITGVRFYKGTGNTGTHTGTLWSADGRVLASGSFSDETASGWQQLTFRTPVPVTAGTTYVASYHAPNGRYAADTGTFTDRGRDNPPLHALQSTAGALNGVYAYGDGGVFPENSWQATNYWVDVVFATAAPADTTPPAVSATSPGQGYTGVATGSPIEFRFDEAVDAASAGVAVTAGGAAVAGTVSAPDATTLVFTPAAPLPAGAEVRAVLSGVRDRAGNALAAPYTLTFTTATTNPSACPCSLFGLGETPAVAAASDTAAVTLGVRFTSDVDGWVTALRFYKGAGNTGTHTGSLWAADGSPLASAVFRSESATGWQQVVLDRPVQVFAGQVYTAAYSTQVGRYSYTYNGFATSGIDRGPLHAPAATSGSPNGVYAYGSARFPNQGSTTNYWVDVVFVTQLPAGTSAASVTLAAAVEDAAPAPDATATRVADTGTATPAEAPTSPAPASTSSAPSSTAPTTTSTAPSTSPAPTTTAPTTTAPTTTAPSTPAPSAPGTPAADAPAEPQTVSVFTADDTPPAEAVDDATPAEVGMRFTSSTDTWVTALRFAKGAGATGTHVGSLWSDTGQRLASVTFTDETADGWQVAELGSPVPLAAGREYVVSYTAPEGRWSATPEGLTAARSSGPLTAPADGERPNGLTGPPGAFPTQSVAGANPWVDVVVTTAAPEGGDTVAPVVTARGPEGAAPAGSAPTALFSEDVTGVEMVLTGPDGAPVPARTVYDPVTLVARLEPEAALTPGAGYTVSVVAARDRAGNVLASPVTWLVTVG